MNRLKWKFLYLNASSYFWVFNYIDLALIGDPTDGLFGVGGILRYLYKYVQVDGLQPRVLG